MKQSTQMVLESIPLLENYMKGDKKKLEGLNQVETTFLNLIKFFENPDEYHFELNSMLENLSDEWLLLALNSINVFFAKDTYLIKSPSHSYIDGSDYLNQKDFVNYLNENGEKYSEAKMSVYIKRNIIPEPDLIISDTRYWLKSTCKNFLRKLKEKGEGYHV